MDANFIGLYLLHRGVITRAQLDAAIERQRQGNRRIGEMAVLRGLLTTAQVEEIFATQHAAERPFGEIALELGLLNRDELDSLLFSQNIHNSHLGEVLLEMGVLSPEQLGSLLEEYHAGEHARAQALRESFGDAEAAQASAALVTALERASLRFLGQEVKPAQGESCADVREDGMARGLRLDLPDGRCLEFRFTLPDEVEDHIARATEGLVHRGPGGALNGADAFFAIVARYARMISALSGRPLRGAQATGDGDFAWTDGPDVVRFCLTAPGGVLLTVAGRVAPRAGA